MHSTLKYSLHLNTFYLIIPLCFMLTFSVFQSRTAIITSDQHRTNTTKDKTPRSNMVFLIILCCYAIGLTNAQLCSTNDPSTDTCAHHHPSVSANAPLSSMCVIFKFKVKFSLTKLITTVHTHYGMTCSNKSYVFYRK